MLGLVLRKSFNTGKWKTLLRLAISRIKLLRNKRDLQLKQMKRDLAQLLHSKQELTAHIRVEHVYREQNIMATYDIIELFCELLVVRLPIIASQRSCPIDLKEAVASLAFAAPRCADLPELQQLSKLFAAKFGKDFVAAAVELRPDCGVNRLVIEKLSVKAPSHEVRLKLMKDVAVESGVEWDDAKTSVLSEFHTPPVENSQSSHFFEPADEGKMGGRTDHEDTAHVELPDLSRHLKPPRAASEEDGANRKGCSKSVRFASSAIDQKGASNGGASRYEDVVAEARAAAQSAERAAAAAMAAASSLASANSMCNNVHGRCGSTSESASSSEEEEEVRKGDVRSAVRATDYMGMQRDGETVRNCGKPIFDEDPEDEDLSCEDEDEDEVDARRMTTQGFDDEGRRRTAPPPQRPPPFLSPHQVLHPTKLPNYDDLATRLDALRCRR